MLYYIQQLRINDRHTDDNEVLVWISYSLTTSVLIVMLSNDTVLHDMYGFNAPCHIYTYNWIDMYAL